MGEAKRQLEEKKKAFAENPHMFIDKRKLIFAAAWLPNGKVGVIINRASKSDYYTGIGEITRRIYNYINFEEVQALKSKPQVEIPDNPDDIINAK